MLAAIYYGAMYGGSMTSILVNVPGEAASAITCLDGYEMAKQGRAGAGAGHRRHRVLRRRHRGHVGAGPAGPAAHPVALRFGPPEFFALMVWGSRW